MASSFQVDASWHAMSDTLTVHASGWSSALCMEVQTASQEGCAYCGHRGLKEVFIDASSFQVDAS